VAYIRPLPLGPLGPAVEALGARLPEASIARLRRSGKLFVVPDVLIGPAFDADVCWKGLGEQTTLMDMIRRLGVMEIKGVARCEGDKGIILLLYGGARSPGRAL